MEDSNCNSIDFDGDVAGSPIPTLAVVVERWPCSAWEIPTGYWQEIGYGVKVA
jgi:hypothetical protein